MTAVEQETPGLFPEPERTGTAGPAEPLTDGERRRARFAAAVTRGQHPLSVTLQAPLPLHPRARRDVGDPGDGTPRCGTCAHREQRHGGSRSFPKCLAGAYTVRVRALSWERGPHIGPDGRYELTIYPRASHGVGTDVRAGWPGCRDYRPAASAPDSVGGAG